MVNVGPMTEALEATTLVPMPDEGRAAVLRQASKIVAGERACQLGQARWCQGCNETRLAVAMRWTLDGVYRCAACIGDGVGTPELWMPPDAFGDGDTAAALLPMFLSVPGGVITRGGVDVVRFQG